MATNESTSAHFKAKTDKQRKGNFETAKFHWIKSRLNAASEYIKVSACVGNVECESSGDSDSDW